VPWDPSAWPPAAQCARWLSEAARSSARPSNVQHPVADQDHHKDAGLACDECELKLVVEILSPTNRDFDRADKSEDYKTVPSLEYILLVDPDVPQVRRKRSFEATVGDG